MTFNRPWILISKYLFLTIKFFIIKDYDYKNLHEIL